MTSALDRLDTLINCVADPDIARKPLAQTMWEVLAQARKEAEARSVPTGGNQLAEAVRAFVVAEDDASHCAYDAMVSALTAWDLRSGGIEPTRADVERFIEDLYLPGEPIYYKIEEMLRGLLARAEAAEARSIPDQGREQEEP